MASAIKQEVVDETEETFNDELKPGTTLMHGQYTIERFINAGGFGITYLARDSLDRKIVIKECFPGTFCRRSDTIVHARSRAHQAELKSIVRLFVQEARSLAKLDHPNIVGVHQVFEDNDTAYMALDFIEGRDLLDTLEDEGSKLQPKDVETMLIQILDAVEFIHQAEMLHRDISPDNILLDAGNKPVLIDFGAAREQATKASRVLSAMRVVKDGYSPQEFYIAGSDQSPSSDLYALGATFYHVITGDTPPNSQARLAAVASGEEDPYEPMTKLSGITGYEKYFLEAIDKALKVLPKDRLQSAKEWKDLILEEKRVEAALRAAQGDAEINTKIASLVSSAEDEPEPAKRETPKPTAPASTVQPRRVKSRVKTRVDANNASRRTRSKVAGLDAAERVALAGAGHSEKKKSKTGLLLASVALVALIAGGVVVTQTGLLTSSDVTPSDEQTESVDTGQATVTPPAASQQETDTSVASAPSPIDGRVQPTEVDQVDAGEAVEPVNSVVANRGQTESASADTAAPDPTSPNEAAAAPTAPSEKTEQVAVADQQTEPSEPTDVVTETPVPNANASTIADTTEAERTTPAQTIAETETPAASENASAPERLTATETEQPLEQPGPDTVTGSAEANLADGPVAVPTPLSPSNGEKADRVASDQDSANIAVAEQTPVNIATSETARATVAEQAPAAAIDQSAADVAVAEQTPESVTAEQTPVVTVPEAAPESVAAADRSTDVSVDR
ncbi:MAG: protein kinase, partial [Pseudomonadota bacterium]